MSPNKISVLFVDDEERILRSLRMLFRGRYEILVTTSAREAIEIVRGQQVHVVVSDQRMPELTGVELLREVREASPSTMRLLLTGYSDLQAIVASVNDGEIFRFLEKPWQAPYVLDAVDQAVKIASAEFSAKATKAPSIVPASGLKLLVLDEDGDTVCMTREMVAEKHEVRHADSVESALAVLSQQNVAIVIAELKHHRDDVAGVLKTLKRYNPATLAIAVSDLGDSRGLIQLINQGQVYRFLPKPLSRELLRRSVQAACDHYARTRAAPILLRRHVVEEAKFEPVSLSAKLLDYWRRIRENSRLRQDM